MSALTSGAKPLVRFGLLLAMLMWSEGMEVASAQEVRGPEQAGKLVYELHCVRCHGPGGGGNGPQAAELLIRPADFHDQRIREKSDEQLLMSIEFGVLMTPMHTWRGRLTGDEMRNVLAYVRQLSEGAR
jgi:mono/diheme cytochrome c family protein